MDDCDWLVSVEKACDWLRIEPGVTVNFFLGHPVYDVGYGCMLYCVLYVFRTDFPIIYWRRSSNGFISVQLTETKVQNSED